MPYFHHVNFRGNTEGKMKKFKLNKKNYLYLAKRGSIFNYMWKAIAWGENKEYEEIKFFIPRKRFTKSFNPKDNTKIIILTKDNLKDFYKYFEGFSNEDLKKRFGGIDATRIGHPGEILGPEFYTFKHSRHDELLLWCYNDVSYKSFGFILDTKEPRIWR